MVQVSYKNQTDILDLQFLYKALEDYGVAYKERAEGIELLRTGDFLILNEVN